MNDFINKAAVFLAIVTVFVITLNSLMSRDLEYLLTAYTIVGNLFLAIVVLLKDPKGHLYIADTGNHRIVELTVKI